MSSPSEWKHNTNIYEVNVRQYTSEGTFKAFEKELPRLQKMGVRTLWFMPITPIAKEKMLGSMGSYYSCRDYTSINPEFGTLDDFKSVVNKAHKLGMYVIIDWVANHTGWDHHWTRTNPEFYKHNEDGSFQTPHGMEDIIQLDFDNNEMRREMIEAMKFWIRETNIDGFRCDLASWVPLDFWEEAKPEVEKIKPLFWLGEYDELENPEYGKVFDVSYAWTWMHESEEYVKGNVSLNKLKRLLYSYSYIGDDSMRAWFTANHDENSWNGTEYEKYGELALPLAVFSVTWNGVPLLYSGQEMPNRKRLKFFEKDAIEWDGQYRLESFYKKLLDLKLNNPVLRGGDSAVTTYLLKTIPDNNVLAYLRKNGDDEVLVLLNLSRETIKFDLDDSIVKGTFVNLFNDSKIEFEGRKEFNMKVSDYLVYVKN